MFLVLAGPIMSLFSLIFSSLLLSSSFWTLKKKKKDREDEDRKSTPEKGLDLEG